MIEYFKRLNENYFIPVKSCICFLLIQGIKNAKLKVYFTVKINIYQSFVFCYIENAICHIEANGLSKISKLTKYDIEKNICRCTCVCNHRVSNMQLNFRHMFVIQVKKFTILHSTFSGLWGRVEFKGNTI
jgi:hypothetical protein